MTSSTHDRYRQLQQVLISAPEVAGKFAVVMTAEGKELRLQNPRKSPEIAEGLAPTRRDGSGTEASDTLGCDREPALGSKSQETSEILEGLDPALRRKGRAADRAAELLNVSADAVKKAARVIRSGDEQLVDAVNKGTVSLDAAAAVASLPRDERREAVKTGRVKETAKKIRRSKVASKSELEPKPKAKGNGKTVKAATPEPTERVDDDAHTPNDQEPDQPIVDDYPLLAEAHEAINEMVRTAGERGCLERLQRPLGAILTACRNIITKINDEPVPWLLGGRGFGLRRSDGWRRFSDHGLTMPRGPQIQTSACRFPKMVTSDWRCRHRSRRRSPHLRARPPLQPSRRRPRDRLVEVLGFVSALHDLASAGPRETSSRGCDMDPRQPEVAEIP
ncbi:MAG: hypothetical protein JW751_30335 [Polyangiaceae bacterium]|nr:hypothetical protein [Polyangiaceae bacterium]